MGTVARIGVVGGRRDLLAGAERLVRDCERRWSRFRPDSELCRLNAAAGRPFLLDPDTFALVEAAVDAWHLTGGRFDPTVLPALVAAGYDRSFAEMAPDVGARTAPGAVPGCAGIHLDPSIGLVTVPAAVQLDLGGIAKGHTADLVVSSLLAGGAQGAMADLGGDVRVAGCPPAGAGAWAVSAAGRVLRLLDGAVVTSSTRRRAWRAGGRTVHHLIDPATGAPAAADVAEVTVVAADAAPAEVVAKAVVVGGEATALDLVRAFGGVAAIVEQTDGSITEVGGVGAFA